MANIIVIISAMCYSTIFFKIFWNPRKLEYTFSGGISNHLNACWKDVIWLESVCVYRTKMGMLYFHFCMILFKFNFRNEL